MHDKSLAFCPYLFFLPSFLRQKFVPFPDDLSYYGEMKRIYVPTEKASDWKRLLAKPDLHWKQGYSAMTAATCWDAAGATLPPEIRTTLNASEIAALHNLELLAALPEWETPLPGGDRPSFTDVMAITRNELGLAVVAVEAKVNEPFGPTVGEKRAWASPGQAHRLAYLESLLDVSNAFAGNVRYQLLHRTASAVLTARQFHAPTAVLLIHSFSSTAKWRDDFEAFCVAMGADLISSNVYRVSRFSSPALFLAWCPGDLSFLTELC